MILIPDIVQRGFIHTDTKEFNNNNLKKLRIAQKDIYYLINNGYGLDQSVTFIGNHHLLSARQRLALKRAITPAKNIDNRKNKLIKDRNYSQNVNIDGLNLIITLEVALSSSTLLRCMDGTIRDLAGLRGTYKLIDKTDIALSLIFKKFVELNMYHVVFYLDSPVSNTARLKQKILEYADKTDINVDVKLVPNADVILENLPNVVTSDGIILNKCINWINLATDIIDNHIVGANIIDLSTLYCT